MQSPRITCVRNENPFSWLLSHYMAVRTIYGQSAQVYVWYWRRKCDLLSSQSLWPWRILHPGVKCHSALAHPGTPSVTQKCHQPSCELDTEALPFQNGLRTTALLSSAFEHVPLAD